MPEPIPDRPRVSLVIPSHDTAELTLQCLASIRRGRGRLSLEVLVVDDASEDGTADAVAAQYPEARILRQHERSGFTVTVNRGLDVAEGELLIALNSDTEVLPGALEALVARFDRQARLGIAGSRLSYPDGSAQWSGGPDPNLLWLFGVASGLPALLARLPVWRRLRPIAGTVGDLRVNWVTGAALAMRREVWRDVGPFDVDYHFYAQDLDLCSRARAAGWEVEIVAAFQVVHHHGATIGQRERSVARQDPALLWVDLIRWAVRHRGASWARRGVFALRLGARLRLFGRWLCEVGMSRAVRDAWRRDSLVYRQALRTLSQALDAATAPRASGIWR